MSEYDTVPVERGGSQFADYGSMLENHQESDHNPERRPWIPQEIAKLIFESFRFSQGSEALQVSLLGYSHLMNCLPK